MEPEEEPQIWFSAVSTSSGKVILQVSVQNCPNEGEVASLMLVCPKRLRLSKSVIMCDTLGDYSVMVLALPLRAECLMPAILKAIQEAVTLFIPRNRQKEKGELMKVESLIRYFLCSVEEDDWAPFLQFCTPGIPRASLVNPSEVSSLLQYLRSVALQHPNDILEIALYQGAQVVTSSPDFPDTIEWIGILQSYLTTLPVFCAEFPLEAVDGFQKCVLLGLTQYTHVCVMGTQKLQANTLAKALLGGSGLPLEKKTLLGKEKWRGCRHEDTTALSQISPYLVCLLATCSGTTDVAITIEATVNPLGVSPLIRTMLLHMQQDHGGDQGALSTDSFDVAWCDGVYALFVADPSGFDADQKISLARQASTVVNGMWQQSLSAAQKAWKKLKW